MNRSCTGHSRGGARQQASGRVLEARLRELCDRLPEPQAWVDADTLEVLWCSRALAEVTGRAAEAIVGGSVLDLVPDHARAAFEALARGGEATASAGAPASAGEATATASAATTTTPPEVSALRGPDGGAIAAAVEVADVREADGSVVERRLVWRLRTASLVRPHLRGDDADAPRWTVEQYRRHLSVVIEASRAAILCCDMRGRILAVNAAAERMFGYARSEILGESVAILTPERLRGEQQALMRRLLAGESVVSHEVVRRRRDGGELLLSMSAWTLRDVAGEVYALCASFHDLTAYAQIVTELREARDAAEAASRSKSQFLANMSHEIRTPMHGVLGMTSVLLGTPLSPDQRDHLETIQSSGQALLAIINDILDLSKIEAGKLGMAAVEVDVPSLVKSVVELMFAQARQKELELTYRVDPGVPARLVGDPIRLQQVLTNLVSNAIKFTDRGRVSIHVAGHVSGGDGEAPGGARAVIRFEVEDTGIGVPPDRQDDIFELFTQVDGTTTRRQGGTGLGLAISRRLVALMGGEIGVASEPGRGSRFWFTAPLQIALEPAAAAAEPARVLVVDDDPLARATLARELTALGVNADELPGWAEVLGHLRGANRAGRPYRLVFVSYDGAGATNRGGDALAAAIKGDPRVGDTAVVLVCAGALPDSKPDVEEVLRAPVRPLQVKACLVEILGAAEPLVRPGRGDTLTGAFADRAARVLLVEDNPVNQKVAQSILERLGCDVAVAANGARALEMFGEGWSLVLMDCQMPVMDGFAATEHIRAQEAGRARTPIIAMTADAMRGDRERCLDAGMDDYLPKPFTVRQMVDVLDRWLPPPRTRLTAPRRATDRAEPPD